MPIEYDLFVEAAAALSVAFVLVGLFALWLGGRAGKYDFREKGYLRPPSGRALLPFLLEKRYEAFNNGSVRFFFGIAHFCLVALMFALGIVILLLAVTYVLDGVAKP
jgi:hypothetical protein